MRIVSSCLVTVLAVGLITAPASAADEPVWLNVGLADLRDAEGVLAGLGDRALDSKPIAGLPAISVKVPAGVSAVTIADLTADSARIRYVETDGIVRANSEIVSGPVLTSSIPAAWTWTSGSSEVTVAVVDTGVTPNTDLPAGRVTSGYDFVDGDTDTTDDDGHGTMVASVIGATRGNDFGAPGICSECRIMPVRVLHADGADPAVGRIADVAAGIVWSADHGARVVNASLSTPTASRLLEDAVVHATAKGAFVVASAGNGAGTARYYPAAYEPALAVSDVSATNPKNTAADRWVDVSVNGIARAVNAAGEPTYLAGGSAASAVAAGIVALGFSTNPSASVAEMRKAVEAHVMPLTKNYPDHHAPRITAPGVLADMGAVDTVPPVLVRSGLTEGELMPAEGRLITPAATDDHAVARIDYLIDGRVVTGLRSVGAALSFVPPAGHQGELPVTVRALDYRGNTDEQIVTVRVDSTLPTATFVTPASDGAVVGASADVVVATDDTDVTTIFGSGGTLSPVAGTNLWSGKVTPSAGAITLIVRDRAGNDITIKRSVVVDRSGPVIYGALPEAGAVLGGDFTTTAQGTSDSNDVAGVELLVNGVRAGSSHVRPYAIPVTGAPAGRVTLTWRATDTIGNVTVVDHVVTVDRSAPTATSSGPAHHARVRGTFTAALAGVSDDNGYAEAELLVNGRSCGLDVSAPFAFRVPTGAYSGYLDLVWRLTDRFGNTRTYTRRVIADNAGPSVTISKAPKNRAKIKGTTRVYVKASDAAGVSRVELIVNGKVVARDYTAGYVLAFNASNQKKTMKVQVRAYDKLGNVKYTSIRTWYRK